MTVSSASPRFHPLLTQFNSWMHEHRGVRASTLVTYGYPLKRLVDALGDSPAKYTSQALRGFICAQAGRHSNSYARRVVSSARSFLHFLSASGRCNPTLVDAIPAVAVWRRAVLPRHIAPALVARALACCDISKPAGLRDRAILLLCSRLGLRAEDIRTLLVDDLDWAEGALRVAGKNRRPTPLPMPQDVGDALLAHLQHRRSDCGVRHVFVRSNRPVAPYKASSSISHIVRDALRRAGVTISPCGAHTLRHTVAFQLLQEGASLETIGTVLRHASVDTTGIYAKVDTRALEEIAQPWPAEVAPC